MGGVHSQVVIEIYIYIYIYIYGKLLRKEKENCVGPIMALHNSSTIFSPRKIVQHLKMNLKTMQGFWVRFKER
jgi:hypothetical protein